MNSKDLLKAIKKKIAEKEKVLRILEEPEANAAYQSAIDEVAFLNQMIECIERTRRARKD
jgi:transcription elongation GreA/GreB family factor